MPCLSPSLHPYANPSNVLFSSPLGFLHFPPRSSYFFTRLSFVFSSPLCAISNFHVHLFVHPATPPPSWPPRESSERAWGNSKCGSTSWRETHYGPRRLRAISLNSTRLVCVCACVCARTLTHMVHVQFKLGTLGTDTPIISLISGITLWGSDSSRSYFQSIWLIPPSLRDIFHIQQHVEYPHFLCTLFWKVWDSEARTRDNTIGN